MAVCGRSAFSGLRAVCVWRFEGGFSGSLRVVCGRFANSWRADCGWRFVGGLRAVCRRLAGVLRLAVCGYDSVTKYTPRDQQKATPNPIKLRIAQRWTSSSSLLKTETMCVCGCMYGCMYGCMCVLSVPFGGLLRKSGEGWGGEIFTQN